MHPKSKSAIDVMDDMIDDEDDDDNEDDDDIMKSSKINHHLHHYHLIKYNNQSWPKEPMGIVVRR